MLFWHMYQVLTLHLPSLEYIQERDDRLCDDFLDENP
jgi:hypothetical protein